MKLYDHQFIYWLYRYTSMSRRLYGTLSCGGLHRVLNEIRFVGWELNNVGHGLIRL